MNFYGTILISKPSVVGYLFFFKKDWFMYVGSEIFNYPVFRAQTLVDVLFYSMSRHKVMFKREFQVLFDFRYQKYAMRLENKLDICTVRADQQPFLWILSK